MNERDWAHDTYSCAKYPACVNLHYHARLITQESCHGGIFQYASAYIIFYKGKDSSNKKKYIYIKLQYPIYVYILLPAVCPRVTISNPPSRIHRSLGGGLPLASQDKVTWSPSSTDTSLLLLLSTIVGGTVCKKKKRVSNGSLNEGFSMQEWEPNSTYKWSLKHISNITTLTISWIFSLIHF